MVSNSNFKRISSKLFSLLTLCLFLLSYSFVSAELSASWYTTKLDTTVGDIVKIDLYLNPEVDNPVFTISSYLSYDNSRLELKDVYFPEGWIVVNNVPNLLTDTVNGNIVRTAGLPNGVTSKTKFITYEFVSKKAGKAKISIEGGTVLDRNSVDIGLQAKQMEINIVEPEVKQVAEVGTSTKVSEVQEVKRVSTLSLDVFGRTGILEGRDYSLVVLSDPKRYKDIISKINVSLKDSNQETLFSKSYIVGRFAEEDVVATIPGQYLKVGDYKVVVTTEYFGTLTTSVTEKEIGVVRSDRDWYDRNRESILVIFLFVTFVAFLYHVHRDHKIIRGLKSRIKKNK